MNTKTQRIIARAAALAAVPAMALALTGTASASSDTPDDYWYQPAIPGDIYVGGVKVMWNDYDDQDHSRDLDNVWVKDGWGDGESTELEVDWKGKEYITHAYAGEIKKLSFGNVPNGAKVHWIVCTWDDGKRQECSDWHWFRE